VVPFSLADLRDFLHIALEALGRYKLRTTLSVLGVVLGVAAVIAMMSVSEGAAREALAQVEALGLDNLVARSQVVGGGAAQQGLQAGDAERIATLVPLVRATSPLLDRFLRISHGDRAAMTRALGVRAAYQPILRLPIDRGRFLSITDERTVAHVAVLGASLARELFGFRDPIGQPVRIGPDYYQVVGVLRARGRDARAGGTLAWHDINDVAYVPFPTLSGRTLTIAPDQPADEIWVQVSEGERSEALAAILTHVLESQPGGRAFNVVVPRELLAQRYRTQRTFSIVVGSIAALALIVGGIGIMNIMLTSVVERTKEIGVRRTVGATRHHVTVQFLIEALLMTLGGGVLGIGLGVAVAAAITAYAGWHTLISPLAVALAFGVSFAVGLVFGIYPAMKAASLEPVDAMRYE
jgi:putative ABC transport system permease protein